MSGNVMVTPWLDSGEWNHVRQLVLSRDSSVLQHFAVWRSRVNRLPTGVETTATLVQAESCMNNDLALATAINRFLNHISHLGMKLWGVGKLHEAAERLQVPEWVVEVRHDSTHGNMPSIDILRAGHELCYSWICKNYWAQLRQIPPPPEATRHDPDQVVKDLLECHMYLKIYLVWGTEKVRDLKDQAEIYSHLRKLWPGYLCDRAGEEFDSMSLKLALGLVKTEILNLEPDASHIARILASEDLLIPEADFLESLSGGEENDEEHVEIPSDLIKIWEEFILRIDEKVGTKLLLDHLVQKIHAEETAEEVKEYTAAWIVVLTEALLGRSELLAPLGREGHGIGRGDIERWLGGDGPPPPHRLLGQLLPCFCELAGLQLAQLSQLRSLLAIATGDIMQEPKRRGHPDPKVESSEEIYTVAHLHLLGKSSLQPAAATWQLVAAPSLSTLQPEDWSSLWLPAATVWRPANSGRTEPASPPPVEFIIERVCWPASAAANSRQSVFTETKETAAVPAFYRNETTRGTPVRSDRSRRFSSPASPFPRKRMKRA